MIPVQLSPAQARVLHAKYTDFVQCLSLLSLGHCPEGSSFTAINPENGVLMMEPPATIAAPAKSADIGEGPE